VAPGEKILIKGPSGMGKTTLVNLLIGNLIPTTGNIFIDGDIPLKYIDEHPGGIGYVPQNVQLIEGSLAQNIDLGLDKDKYNFENMQNGLRISSLNDFLENFPESVNLLLGELGFGLSGGQKQRLGIARALYSNPGLVIFDEPTSSLDLENELAFIECLSRIVGGPTMIIISHSSSFDVIADHTYLLQENEDGSISIR